MVPKALEYHSDRVYFVICVIRGLVLIRFFHQRCFPLFPFPAGKNQKNIPAAVSITQAEFASRAAI